MKNILLFLILPFCCLAQKPVFSTAKTTEATVYFNGAEMTQTTSVKLPSGASELIIANIADNIHENTVQINAPASMTILSVQFTNNYISEYESGENAPAILKVRDSIRIIQREIMRLSNAKDSEAKAIELLDKNQQVSGTNNGLILSELTKVVEYYKAKRTELSNSYDNLEEKIKNLNIKLAALQTKIEAGRNTEKLSKGKLIVQLMSETAGTVPLTISYITPNAWWKPFYELRAGNTTDPIDMLYKAEVTQASGIDWKQVKLMLSSGNPNQNNQMPQLQSWFLRYADNYRAGDQMNGYLNKVKGVAPGIDSERYSATERLESVVVSRSPNDYISSNENQLNVSFDIDIPYDILSNRKAHSVSLNRIKLPATYKYYAAPRLEKDAFLLAEITDYGKYNLLQGEANIIFEGMYVGKTLINPNQTADTLNLSMGRDKKISIKREKIADKSGTRLLSSKKEQTFTFDISIRNNKKDAIKMLLKDQIPLSTDKDVEVSLIESDGAKVGAETGILTWEVSLKPNESKKLRISYKVRYPRDKVLQNL